MLRAAARLTRPPTRLQFRTHGRPGYTHRSLTQPSHSRTLFHLPALAAGAGKIIATAGLKKVAVNSVVRKLGVRRVLADLRAANKKLADSRVYSAETSKSVSAGLDSLEKSLAGVQENEQVMKVWKWFETLEKQHPNLYAAVFKSYAETCVRWLTMPPALSEDPAAPSGPLKAQAAPTQPGPQAEQLRG
jgi:hypothetical protein